MRIAAVPEHVATPHPIEARALSWPRVLLIAEWTLLVFGTAYFGARALPRAWKNLNTDFPNYYITARLVREGSSIERVYEWTWFQRQKDRFEIDQPVVGFMSLTPFSTLFMVPVAGLPPLAAKRAWILISLLLLAVTLALIRSLGNQSWRRILLITVLCYPLYRNLEYGQYYILLLLLVTFSLWLYARECFFAAGMVVGIAAGLKVFPILFLLYFFRKRQWRAVAGLAFGILCVTILSIAVFGVPLNEKFLMEVLPSTLRGEAMDPYSVNASSISSLLHHLFIFEPEWNPHPIVHWPFVVAILQPLLQLFVLGLAVLFISPQSNPERDRLEWCTLTLALLAMSTNPASYHFVLLLLPVCLWLGFLEAQKHNKEMLFILLLFLGICFPAWPRINADGFAVLLAEPRLYCILLLTFVGFWLMVRALPGRCPPLNLKWAFAFGLMFIVQAMMMIRHQSGLYSSYAWRIPTSSRVFAIASLNNAAGAIDFTAMTDEGWASATRSPSGSLMLDRGSHDRLSQFSTTDARWIEEAGRQSGIYIENDPGLPTRRAIDGAEQPVAGDNGQRLAFLRRSDGRASLWTVSASGEEARVVPEIFDVLEMSFTPDGRLIFAASPDGVPALFALGGKGVITPIGIADARFPSISPDGSWLAYSKRSHGVWNLWIRNLQTDADRRITSADCNDLSPTWEPDSRTLDYVSDCGRGLWLTALYRRNVVRFPSQIEH